MKKTLIVLIVIMFIVSCSKDDDSTFLETYDNTVWRFDYSGTDDAPHHNYFRFINNTDDIIEFWPGYSADNEICTYYTNFGHEFTIEIIENSKDKLVIKFESDPGVFNTHSFVANGEVISFESKEIDNNRTTIDLYNGTKSTLDVDALKICN